MPKQVKQEKSFNTMASKVDTSHIRRSMLNDVEHLVVPIVALVEGVLHSGNSPHPELALASEFGKFPTSWNGRPVTLDHPQRDDQFVSASASPDVYEEETIGILFNTKLDGKKLKTEAWINLTTVANASQKVKDEVDRLEKGEVVEVSTGLFTMAEEEHGKFNSKEYHAVWREIVPDHLAILPLGIVGACSVADGCGARVNMKVNCQCQEHKDPKANEEGGEADKKPKVNGEEDEGDEGDEKTSVERTKFLRGLKEKFAGIFKLSNNSQAGELSDMDTRAAIKAALKLEEDYSWSEVVAVFSTSFIYAPGWDGTLYERDYTISSNGDVNLGADKTRVRPETTFVPVTITEETRMNKKEKVDALITNSATQFAEGDREWLEKQDDAMLDKLAPVVNAEDTNNGQSSKTTTTKEKTVAESAKDDAAGQQPNTNAAAPKAATVEEYIAAAPVELQAVLSSGLRAQQAKIDNLVKGIMANKQNQYTEAELRTMAEPMLEKLSKIAQVPDYSGQAGGTISVNSENRVPDAPKLFPVKQA